MTAATARRTGPARVLLVEDSKLDLRLTLDAFSEVLPDTRVDSAPTGEDALAHLGKGTPPDLILLDLKLPGISGHEVLRRVKGQPRLRRVPILIFSSSAEAQDRAISYDGGANGYLVKPGIGMASWAPSVRWATSGWSGTLPLPGWGRKGRAASLDQRRT